MSAAPNNRARLTELVNQGCDECSFTWGISEEVHQTTVGKRELDINRSMVTFKGSTRYVRPVLTLCRRTLDS